jgi:glutathione gamma-glutamylcysteinyltransferase
VLVVAYDRGSLGQTGSGHFSPIGGYHPGRDLALVLDVARFKYPPHWIAVDQLWQATQPVDPTSGRSRGWILLRARPAGIALGYTLRCDGHDLQAFARRFLAVVDELGAGPVDPLARALAPLTAHLELREPTSEDHQAVVAATHAALRALPVFEGVRAAVGGERAEAVMLLLGAAAAWRAADPGSELGGLLTTARRDEVLARELEHLHVQLDALSRVVRRGQVA